MTYIPPGRRLWILLVGYGVIGLFLLAFWMVQRVRQLPGEFSFSEGITFAIILVAPVLVALLWGNVHALKFGEIEVSLNDVTAKLDFELASKIQTMQGSLTQELVNAMSEAIVRPELKLVEVNLRTGDYWWSTRLFLLAALAQEYTQIARLVFVEQNDRRRYVGMASPSVVREALAKQFSYLDQAFIEIRLTAGSGVQAVQAFGWQWPDFLFLDKSQQPKQGEEKQEKRAMKPVSAETLRRWISLETHGVQWNSSRGDRPLFNKILHRDEPYVPLLRGTRLELIVNRQDLVHQLAQSG